MIRKMLIDKFLEHLQSAYSSHCEKYHIKKSEESFITFLIDQDLIPSSQIKRFTICREFKKQYSADTKKTTLVKKIANVFNISERHTWGVLKYEAELKGEK